MKRTNLIIFSLLLPVIVLWTACDKREPADYENDPRLNFWHNDLSNVTNPIIQKDSIAHSFLYVNSAQKYDTVHVALQAMGIAADYDRPVSLRQINQAESHAAVAGTHYVPFGELAELQIIPAGKLLVYIPIVLIQDESLDTQEYRLQVEIAPNEYFGSGIPDYQQFVIRTSNFYSKPSVWDSYRWYTYFGDWGVVKFRFLIDNVTGQIEWEARPVTDEVIHFNHLAREKLAEYEAVNGPLYEDPNDPESRVTFPVLIQ